MAKISLIQNVKQSQKMALTPQLLKAIKLLELNNIDLDNYLQQEVLENPLLEKVSENEHPEEIIKSEISNDSPDENIENSLLHEEDFQGSPSFDTGNLYDSSSTFIDNIIEETLQSENSLYQCIIEQIKPLAPSACHASPPFGPGFMVVRQAHRRARCEDEALVSSVLSRYLLSSPHARGFLSVGTSTSTHSTSHACRRSRTRGAGCRCTW